MTESARLRNVLVGVDGTSGGRDAIALADRLCAGEGDLTLAHIVLAQTPIHRNFHSTPAWKDHARQMLGRERDAAGVSAELTGMFASSVGRGLHQLADDCDADVIVMGSCSRGPIGRVLVGDDARGTVSGASCPVAVAPHGYAARDAEIRVIGVAYNGSPESESALDAARHLASRHGAMLQALRVFPPTTAVVWPAPGTQHAGTPLDRTFEDFEQEASQRLVSCTGVDGHVTVGLPGQELLAFSDAVDLLVMGSRGHGPLRRLILGSTSMQLTREARCPLLIAPGPAPADEYGDTE